MINLPDDTLLQSIEPQKAYCDYKSTEPFTNITKKKYKLAGNIIKLPPSLLCYPFFVLTRNKEACQECLTVCIQTNHWENKQAGHLESESYIDIKKVDALERDDILQKMKDTENGFPYVARLCDAKFRELQERQVNLHRARGLSDRQSSIIQCALAEADIPEKILRNLSII